jgi:ferredoxin
MLTSQGHFIHKQRRVPFFRSFPSAAFESATRSLEKGGEMKAKVIEDLCIGCESCTDICPDVFEMQDELAVCRFDEDIPEEFEDACREAAESCPVEAIEIEE